MKTRFVASKSDRVVARTTNGTSRWSCCPVSAALLLAVAAVSNFTPAQAQTNAVSDAAITNSVQSDWTEFHKPNMQRWNGVEKRLSVQNVGRLQNLWTQFTSSGGVFTAPAVANGVVY